MEFLGDYFLHNSSLHLAGNQTLYVSGAFSGEIIDTAWFVTSTNQPEPDPQFSCNAEEANTKLWLHAHKTPYDRILMITPDTDVYMVGLCLNCTKSKEIIAQINPYNVRQLRLLHLSRLLTALETNPDLAKVQSSYLPNILHGHWL